MYLDKKILYPNDMNNNLQYILKNNVIFEDNDINVSNTNFYDCYLPIIKVILNNLTPSTDNDGPFFEKLKTAVLELYKNFKTQNLNINKNHFMRVLLHLYLMLQPYEGLSDILDNVKLGGKDCNDKNNLDDLNYSNNMDDLTDSDDLDDLADLAEEYFDSLAGNDESDLVLFMISFLPEKFRYLAFSRLIKSNLNISSIIVPRN